MTPDAAGPVEAVLTAHHTFGPAFAAVDAEWEGGARATATWAVHNRVLVVTVRVAVAVEYERAEPLFTEHGAAERRAWEADVLERFVCALPEKGAEWAPDYVKAITGAMLDARDATPGAVAVLAAERRAGAVSAIQPFEELFGGGPDTPCRTVWHDLIDAHGAAYGRSEHVEVPMEDLRGAFARAAALGDRADEAVES